MLLHPLFRAAAAAAAFFGSLADALRPVRLYAIDVTDADRVFYVDEGDEWLRDIVVSQAVARGQRALVRVEVMPTWRARRVPTTCVGE
jgi:hypothetical protein